MRKTDGRDRNGEPSREHLTVLHAAIVAAEALRQRVALHELVQLRRDCFPARAGDMQQSVDRDAQRAQQLAAIERAHESAVEARFHARALVPGGEQTRDVTLRVRGPSSAAGEKQRDHQCEP